MKKYFIERTSKGEWIVVSSEVGNHTGGVVVAGPYESRQIAENKRDAMAASQDAQKLTPSRFTIVLDSYTENDTQALGFLADVEELARKHGYIIGKHGMWYSRKFGADDPRRPERFRREI